MYICIHVLATRIKQGFPGSDKFAFCVIVNSPEWIKFFICIMTNGARITDFSALKI